jgi:spore coat protein U-like protein
MGASWSAAIGVNVMKSTKIAAALLAGTAVLAASPAFAGNTVASQTIGVGLTIEDQCTITAPATLSFGTHGIILTDVDAQANMTIECTKETPYSIGLDDGLNHASATTTTRAMKSGTNYINYELYSGSAGGTFWGETVGTDTVDSSSAAGSDEVITIYGQVPQHQNQPVGNYSDTVTATIWYAADAAP